MRVSILEHKALRLPRNLRFEVHKVLCLLRNLHFEVHKVLCLPRNLHFKVHKILHLPQFLKPATCRKVTIHCACHEISGEDHHHVQSAAHATKSARRSKTAPIPYPCREKWILDHQSRFPLRLPRKVTAMSENAHGAATRAQSREAPAAPAQILRPCAVEVHFEDFERHECTANSTEIAGPDRATPRFDTGA